MKISIKNRSDIFTYDITNADDRGYDNTPPEVVSGEYHVNLNAISSLKFHDNFDFFFRGPEPTPELGGCKKAIVLSFADKHEVIAFEESAVGEYQRFKRELESLFDEKVPEKKTLVIEDAD